MIDQANGLLPILTFDEADGWDKLEILASPELTQNGFARLKKSLGSWAKTIAIERHYIDKDFRDTFSNFHSKKFITPNSRCLRLHFFSERVSRCDIIEKRVQDAYLGYSIIRPTRPNCIGRTLLRPRIELNKKIYMRLCTEKVRLQGIDFEVKGFPFISQDTDITVCAQSALWMLSRYYSDKYCIYKEMYPYQIAKSVENCSYGRWYPSSGLYIWQMSESLRQMGFHPVVYYRVNYKEIFEHLIYTYIESGIPVILSTKNHTFVAFGHVSQYSKPFSLLKKTFYSSEFNHAFVINNDNCYPYQVLLDSGNHAKIVDGLNVSDFTFQDIESFIAPLAEKVFLTAEQFEQVVLAILDGKDFGCRSSSVSLSGEKLVFRMFLTTSASYKRKLHERGMGNAIVEEVYRNLPLPHFFWICEISDLDNYLNNKICGEIIWDATRNVWEPDGWIAVHYPEMLAIDYGSALNKSPSFLKFKLSNSNSYPAYQSNLEEIL